MAGLLERAEWFFLDEMTPEEFTKAHEETPAENRFVDESVKRMHFFRFANYRRETKSAIHTSATSTV
jgi:hypothetical protein